MSPPVPDWHVTVDGKHAFDLRIADADGALDAAEVFARWDGVAPPTAYTMTVTCSDTG